MIRDSSASSTCGALCRSMVSARFATIAVGAVLLAITFFTLVFSADNVDTFRHRVSSVFPSTTVSHPDYRPPLTTPDTDIGGWTFSYDRDALNYGLTSAQCDIAFPDLFGEISRSMDSLKGRTVTSADLDENMRLGGDGMLRGLIYDGRLYIVASNKADGDLFSGRSMAFLHALNRAILTAPERVPNVEFTITMHDTTYFAFEKHEPDRTVWSWTRKVTDKKVWVVPEFGKWGWAVAHIGAPEDVRRLMGEVETRIKKRYFLSQATVSSKIKDLFRNIDSSDGDQSWLAAKQQTLGWRGMLDTASELRGSLLNATRGKAWADVLAREANGTNEVPIHEHCKWMYLAYTEGYSYSGRLKYLQNCESVIISHKMNWFVPWHQLLITSGPEQNVVEVERDWSDLQSKMELLLSDTPLTLRIASNSVKTFKYRYLAPAAEACYWRKLLAAWREVSFEPSFYRVDAASRTGYSSWRGFPFETYAITGRVGW